MKVIKIIDFLAGGISDKHIGEIITHNILKEKEHLINLMEERIRCIEKSNFKENENFRKLSKEQEINFIKRLILRLKLEND
ncbi:MAG: hypothetical protein N2202_04895 [Proteobacteria bacterium]|nr:hypothetical protein [Pseudomonadota bacterium]